MKVPLPVIVAIAIVIAACEADELVAVQEPVLQTNVVCEDGAGPYDVYVERRIVEIGPSGNDLRYGDGALWVVESAANTTSRFDLATEDYEAGFVDVGNDRNPYALAIDEGRREVWIANYAMATVTVASIDDGEILMEIDDEVMQNPSSLALSDDYAYVGDVQFLSSSQGYGPGAIHVVDRSNFEVVASMEPAFQNPHFLDVHEVDGESILIVSSAGALDLSGGVVEVVSEGGLEWFDIGEDSLQPPSEAFALGQTEVATVGAPGRPLRTPDGKRLYFVSVVAPVVFAFDLQQRSWIYDASDPLVLYESQGNTTHRGAIDDDGLLWVTAFNEDGLYLLDTACDEVVAGPIDLGVVADMLEGPQAVTTVDREDGIDGYYLLSIANAMGRVRLEEMGDQR